MKKYLPAIFALSAPVIFVLGVVLYVTFFTSPISPEYDFIMSNSRYSYVFSIENNRIKIDEERVEELKENKRDFYPEDELEFWYYSVKEDTFEKIDIEEAEKLVLDKSKESPDGFEVKYIYSYGVFNIFGTRSQRGYYIQKDNKGSKLNINDYGMSFIGWVIR